MKDLHDTATPDLFPGPGLRFARCRAVKPPRRANYGDAGVDFFVPDSFAGVRLLHGEDVLIPSGVRVDVPRGWALVFMNKSGVATRKRLDVLACVVDHGYQGEVHLHVVNSGVSPVVIEPGDKLLQGVLLPVGQHRPVEVPEAVLFEDPSARGTGGFGSTGTS